LLAWQVTCSSLLDMLDCGVAVLTCKLELVHQVVTCPFVQVLPSLETLPQFASSVGLGIRAPPFPFWVAKRLPASVVL